MRCGECLELNCASSFVTVNVQLYKGREMPVKPKLPSLFDLTIRSIMARRIQNLWIFFQAEKRIHNEIRQNEEYISKYATLSPLCLCCSHDARRMANMNQTDMDEIGQAEIMYMDDHHEIDIEGGASHCC